MPRAWLLLLLVFLAGCGEKIQQTGGQYHPPMTNIVSLSPSTTEIVGLVASTALKGRTASCNYPNFATSIPVFATVKPDYEKLANARPDLIVYDANLYSPADEAKLESLHLRTFKVHATTIDDFQSQLRALGDLIGMPREMSEYLDKIDSERNAARADIPAHPPKVAAFTGNLIAGTKSFIADVIRTVGGEPVGPDADRFVANDPETLIKSNPDVILVAADVANLKDSAQKRAALLKAAQSFANDPRYKSIAAVNSGHVVPMDADIMLRQGFRVDTFIRLISPVIHSAAK
jgi:ABC-type Fe3+-hydroxamate transport system substrate-binding protein